MPYPILVDGVFNKEGNTQHKYQDTYLTEEVFADKLLVVETSIFVVCTHCGAVYSLTFGCSMLILCLQIGSTGQNRLFLRLLNPFLLGFVLHKGSHRHMQLRLLLGRIFTLFFGIVGLLFVVNALRFVVAVLLFGIVVLQFCTSLRCFNFASGRRFCMM